MFAVERFSGTRKVRVAVCGFFLCGSLVALLIGWGNGDRWGPGMRSTGSINNSTALAETDLGPRRGQLPIEVNEAVEAWMLHFTTDRKSVFEQVLSRAGLYSDMIQSKLRERGMPEELLYLAMIESDFYTTARSRVSASGMWQFMEPTAIRYGLRIDAYVDERYDPVRATDAALDYLSDLYRQFGSWYLATAAYNVGEGRISDILRPYADRRFGDDSLFWEIVDHLPEETANYVPKLLAVTSLAQSAAQHNLEVRRVDPYEYDTVWSPAGVDLSELAHSLGIAADQMHDLNPHLIRRETPPGEIYPLRVPVGMVSPVVAALASANQETRVTDD